MRQCLLGFVLFSSERFFSLVRFNSWENAVKMDFSAEAHTPVQFGIARKLAQQQMSSSNSLIYTSNYGELKQIISPD